MHRETRCMCPRPYAQHPLMLPEHAESFLRVLVFEPVPHFRAFLEYNVYLNGVEHLVEFHTNVVSHVHNQPMTMMVPSNGIWGTAGIDGLNIDSSIKSE